jgi:hypothetical protein
MPLLDAVFYGLRRSGSRLGIQAAGELRILERRATVTEERIVRPAGL